ncbi:M3 family oligoendopeptidase [Planctomycetales bacterium ZRK34]|nr:M3 family oligoendopeptidase [Planctomycetales bacterium ZRK34]
MNTPSNAAVLPELDVADWSQVQPRLQQFIDATPDSADALRRWVSELSRLSEVIYEFGSRKNIDNACHTDDEAIEAAYLHWVREIAPKLQPMFFEIQKNYLANPHRDALTDQGFDMMLREWSADVDIFRPENVALQTQITELVTQYDKLQGAMMIEFRGETYTPQQIARFYDDVDRDTREQAWRAAAERRYADHEAVEDLFDPMLKLRQQVAENAGFNDYREYIWTSRYRFDYTPEDCLEFGKAVERVCMPLAQQVDVDRKAALGVDALRPWDTSVDVHGRPPLRPFDPKNIDDFVAKTRVIFDRIDPRLAAGFDALSEHGNLDLDSRKGKRPGGFQASLEATRQPFIFMNAAGLQRDVETLIHEGGHAFHYQAASTIDNLFTRHAPLEFCEVASMSMELLAMDHFDVFYDSPENTARAKRSKLEGVLHTLTWVATIDGFQHWLYTHPGHTRDEREAAWLDLLSRFGSDVVDWAGLENFRRTMWHRQVHLFHVPFYYIEYAIAQLGALGVWLNYRRDPKAALAQLLDAFALGGAAPLPTLFETAGVNFDFSEKTIAPLVENLQQEIEALPV